MISLIVWSKDRACQLHLLLESIAKHAPGLFNVDILYLYSDDQYKAGYEILQSKSWQNVNWHYQNDKFKTHTLAFVNNGSNYIAFSTDDTVIYRQSPYHIDELSHYLPKSPTECFSFRLGLNTIIQNPFTGELQTPLSRYTKIKQMVFWNNTLYNPIHNYGYPFAMDMHVFNRSILLELLPLIEFSSSNQLESGLFQYANRIIYMSSFVQSIAVNIPMNNLSGITAIGSKAYTVEELNSLYLEGKRISLSSFNTSIRGCHQEFDLEFYNE